MTERLPIVDLPTPTLLLDQHVLGDNASRMRIRLSDLGVQLRPHMKTAKSADVATIASGGRVGPITVSTLREAAYFLDNGFTDLLYAVGITPGKLDTAAALAHRGADLKIITDDPGVADAIVAHARSAAVVTQVMVEVDTGGRRAGVSPDGEELLDVARRLHGQTNVDLIGVMTHAGQSYHARDVLDVRRIARDERDGVVHAAIRLRDDGISCPVVSAGSTPTAVQAEDLSGVTEMRPGVYVFNDLDQLALGSCRRDDLALSVLASVIGHNRHAGHILIDAGALALSKDTSANEFYPEVGYGEVCDPLNLSHFAGLFVADVHQEHGIVSVHEPQWFESLPVGAKVRVLPNHACLTAAAYGHYDVVDGDYAVARWDRIGGW